MTHSIKQTSITGWTDWYTCTNTVSLSLVQVPLVGVFCCFVSSHGSGPLSRWQSCCMLEDQQSTCTCCAIFCAVLLELASGLHTSFRLVRETSSHLLLSCQRLNILTEFSSQFLPQIQVWGNTCGVQHFMQALTILMSPAR